MAMSGRTESEEEIGGIRRIGLVTERIEDFRLPVPSDLAESLPQQVKDTLLQPQPTAVVEIEFCPPGERWRTIRVGIPLAVLKRFLWDAAAQVSEYESETARPESVQ